MANRKTKVKAAVLADFMLDTAAYLANSVHENLKYHSTPHGSATGWSLVWNIFRSHGRKRVGAVKLLLRLRLKPFRFVGLAQAVMGLLHLRGDCDGLFQCLHRIVDALLIEI